VEVETKKDSVNPRSSAKQPLKYKPAIIDSNFAHPPVPPPGELTRT